MKKLLAAILLFTLPAIADFKVPELKNPVNDYANVLTRSGKERIATEIVRLKKETGAQAGVLIVNSLDGSSIEEASMASARQWKLGSKDRDDGILLVVAMKDRKMRLEVGYGLESIITDYHAKQITASMRSGLKSGDVDGAVLAAISGVSARIKAHAEEITNKTTATPEPESDSLPTVLSIFGFLALAVGLIYLFVSRRNARIQKERVLAARRLAKEPLTGDQRVLAALMAADLAKHAKKNPITPNREPASTRKDDDSFVSGVAVGSILSSRSDDYSSSSSSDYSSSSSDSSSSWSGGGGDFGGGGSSDSF